jgi:hypothetical protein
MKTIGGIDRNKLLDIAEEVVKRFLVLPENPKPEKKGCYICIASDVSRLEFPIHLITELGSCDPEKVSSCFYFCQEEVVRMLKGSFCSSWQSRNISFHQYGGAVSAMYGPLASEIGKNMGIGISGFTEEGDEAVALVIGIWARWLVLYDAECIVAVSNNKLFHPLMKACGDLFQ